MVSWHKVPEGEATLDPLTSLAGLVVKGEDFRATLSEIATATTLTDNHFLVLVSSGVTITLPSAINHKERIYTIKNIGTGQVTISAYSNETIDGESTLYLNSQYSYVMIVSDGSEWFIIGGRNVKLEDKLNDLLTEQKETNEKLTDYLKQIAEKLAALASEMYSSLRR